MPFIIKPQRKHVQVKKQMKVDLFIGEKNETIKTVRKAEEGLEKNELINLINLPENSDDVSMSSFSDLESSSNLYEILSDFKDFSQKYEDLETLSFIDC